MTVKPWTFHPYELDHVQTWAVYDENLARIVATFYDHDEARDYLRWRNKKQAKRQAKADRKRTRQQAAREVRLHDRIVEPTV